MTLNIKDPETHLLASALAEETGETMTHAVTEAIRERLERIRQKQKQEATVDDLLAIGGRCASNLKGKPVDHAAFLYDDRGLPR